MLWTAARQASLSFSIFWSWLRLMFIELTMPSNHLSVKFWARQLEIQRWNTGFCHEYIYHLGAKKMWEKLWSSYFEKSTCPLDFWIWAKHWYLSAIDYSKPLTYEPSSCKLSKMWTCVPSISDENEIAVCPPPPIGDDPSALPFPTFYWVTRALLFISFGFMSLRSTPKLSRSILFCTPKKFAHLGNKLYYLLFFKALIEHS